jgi:hypothetical protein
MRINFHTTHIIIGIWILISPWLFGFSDISLAKWSNVILGLLLIIMNVWVLLDAVDIDTSEIIAKKK